MKCVFLLLNQVFFGVSKADRYDTTKSTFECNVCVSYDFNFLHGSKVSEMDAQNRASLKALQNLCEIENKFVQRERNRAFSASFADRIQRYGFNLLTTFLSLVNFFASSNLLSA